MLKAIVSVEYSDCSEIGEDLQEENISITPLHANMNKYEAVNEECSQFWKEMLDQLGLQLDSDKLYHTIFEVELSWIRIIGVKLIPVGMLSLLIMKLSVSLVKIMNLRITLKQILVL